MGRDGVQWGGVSYAPRGGRDRKTQVPQESGRRMSTGMFNFGWHNHKRRPLEQKPRPGTQTKRVLLFH